MDNEVLRKRKRNNIILASALGIFVLVVLAYSMRFIWPHVDVFNR